MIPQRGDILAYHRVKTAGEILIDLGEELQDGAQPEFYYHVAIALDVGTQVAAMAGRGVIAYPIISAADPYTIFRPRIDAGNRQAGLAVVESMIGQRYDNLLIVDDALRMLTGGHLHLPDRWVRGEERTHKICSSLIVRYLNAAQFSSSLPLSYQSTPQDVALALRKYRVAS